MQKILVVEDSIDTQIIVKALLGTKYSLTVVGSSAEAQQELLLHDYQLLILDIELPQESGLDFCKKLRSDEKYKNTHIVFLTGKNEVSDKVLGFSTGGDDYITKPIIPQEFTARIDALMRRIKDSKKEQETAFYGMFKVNLPFQKVSIMKDEEEKELKLTSVEFKLLYYFLLHEDQVLSRDDILTNVWGDSVHVSDRTVDTHVYGLRMKLGKGSDLIQSVPRQGYKFSQKWIKFAA